MLCEKCGAKNPDNAAFCKSCGTRLIATQKVPTNTATRVPATSQRGGTKKRPISTTRKTSIGYLVGQMIGDGCFVGLSVFFFIRAGELIESYWYRSQGATLRTAGIVCLLLGVLSACYHVMVSRTYADIFEDRISGSGMQGIQNKSFSLRFDQIVGVSVSKGFLNLEAGGGAFLIINTSAGDYKIITTAERANEIAEYYSRSAHRRRPRHER